MKDERPTLADLGLTKKESSAAQKLCDAPAAVRAAFEAGEASKSEALREVKSAARDHRRRKQADQASGDPRAPQAQDGRAWPRARHGRSLYVDYGARLKLWRYRACLGHQGTHDRRVGHVVRGAAL